MSRPLILKLGLYKISTVANPESGCFSEIQIASPIWWMPIQLQYIQLITDKTNAADPSCGLFALLISATLKKNRTEFFAIQQMSSKTYSDVTKEALNCTASL